MSEWFWKKLNIYFGWISTAVLFGLIIFAANIEIKDLDLWLHLATGRYIVQNLTIPHTDILSCTIFGQPWINHEWLFQVIIHTIFQFAGAQGLINLQVFIVVLTFLMLLLAGYNRERQVGPLFVLLLVMQVYTIRFTIRPEIFSVLFFALYIHILALHLNSNRAIWVLGAIQIFWTNIHGFFIVGPLLILIGLFAEWIKRHVRLPFQWNTIGRLTDEEYRRLKQIFICVILATLVNPYFIKGLWYPVSVLFSVSGESKVFYQHIVELQKPILFSNIFTFHAYPFYKILIVISFLSFFTNFRKIDISAVLLWIAFLAFSLNAVRNVVFFALVAYFIFLINIHCRSWQEIFKIEFKDKRFQYICSIILLIFLNMWMLDYLGRSSLRGYFDFKKLERKSEYGGISLRNFPHEAVDFLVDNDIKGNFFNNFNSGAYLLGRTHPDIKVFIDGRTEVYGAQFFENYKKIWEGDVKKFDQAVEQYNLTGAFLSFVKYPAHSKLLSHLYKNKDWILVYFNYDGAIFLKNIEENQNWIKSHGLDLSHWKPQKIDLAQLGARNVTPYQQAQRALALLHLEFYGLAKEEAIEALRISPQYDKPYKILGQIDLKNKSYESAYQKFRTAKVLNPRDDETRYLLARSFYHLNNFAEAQKLCEHLISKNSKNSKVLFQLSLIYAKQQRYDLAFQTAKKAHDISPLNVEGVVNIGRLFRKEDKLDLARRILALGLQANPDNELLAKEVRYE